jgi:ribose-phosphate pyrophosphokinase
MQSKTVENIALFAFAAGRSYGERVASQLGTPLAPLEEREFEDGEHKARPLASVRGKDAVIVCALYGDDDLSVNDKLCRLLFFAGALRDADAATVTAVAPYLCYARKDRKTKARDPITSRYVAQLFEAMGIARIATMDVHNLAAFQNAFRCPTEHLEAKYLFVEHFTKVGRAERPAVISPDVGGIKRAEEFRRALGEVVAEPVTGGFMEKRRSRGVVAGEVLVADVAGRDVIIFDDLISSGTTMLRCAKAARAAGARKVYAAATHGLFMARASEVFADPAIDRVVITDTVPPLRLSPRVAEEKLTVLDTTAMVAEAIRRIQTQGSIVELLRTET